MSIFDKKNQPDKWKNKYFDLLDENESLLETQKDKESLLCKTIIRLCLATSGYNKDLDPHLLNIRNLLKKGFKSEQLKIELEAFSNTLMLLDDTVEQDTNEDVGLLFDFLIYHFPDQKLQFQQLEAKFERKEIPNSDYLFIAINDYIDSIQQIDIMPVVENQAQQDEFESIDSNQVNLHLQQLIESLVIPVEFNQEAQAILDMLHEGDSLTKTLDQTSQFLFNLKKFSQTEQNDITLFLKHLSEQLNEIGMQATGVDMASKSSTEQQKIREESVTSQMVDLKKSTNDVTQLETLKQLIDKHLAEIAQQIKVNQIKAEIERSKMHGQLHALSGKVKDMHTESNQLKNKLDDAHYQATHDVLTGLPNRLAYDQRLEMELARLKRYKTPLSLLIWDIDLFKGINDQFGHKAGDKTLCLIAKLLKEHCRETDFVSRFGGEEFTMLLSNADAELSLQTANKLRKVVENTAFHSNKKKISITISCGITQFMESDTGQSAFERADSALYKAKQKGRNQCVIS